MYDFVTHRTQLIRSFDLKESHDRASGSTASSEMDQRGLKAYWIQKNVRSVDGLPGLLTAPDSKVTPISVFDKEGPRPMLRRPSSRDANAVSISATLAIGFTLGALAATVLPRILFNVGKFDIFTST